MCRVQMGTECISRLLTGLLGCGECGFQLFGREGIGPVHCSVVVNNDPKMRLGGVSILGPEPLALSAIQGLTGNFHGFSY